MLKHHRFRSPVWLLGLLLMAPFMGVLLAPAGRILGSADCDGPGLFYYFNAFASACWRQGEVPLWNPCIMLGYPFLGEGQAALFHPLSWLFVLLPTGLAINWAVALCFLLTGLSFYGYLRALRLSRDTAFCGALVWCCSNVLIPRLFAGHLAHMLEQIEIPLILMLWERYRQARARRYLVGLALAYGAMILAAYPQFLYIFSLFFCCYALIQAALNSTSKAAALQEGRALLWLGAAVLLGIGIGAVQLLPTADFAAQSFRRQASIEFAGVFSFPVENLGTLLAPRFFGYMFKGGSEVYWGYGNFWEMTCYIGMLPLVLVAAGVMAAPLRRRLPLIACALIFLIFALGRNTPFFPLIYKCVPFFRLFRGPSKFMLMTQLCLVTLSAYGFESLFHPSGAGADRRRFKPALIAGAGLLICALGLSFYVTPHPESADSNWARLVDWILGPGRQVIPPQAAIATSRWASHELLRSAAFLVLSLGLIILAWKASAWRRAWAALASILAVADLLMVFSPFFTTYSESITRGPDELFAPLQKKTYPMRALAPDFPPNLPILYGFSSPSGYTGNTLARFNTYVNAMKGLPPETEQMLNPVNAYLPQMRCWAFDAMIVPNRVFPLGQEILARVDNQVTIPIPFAEEFPRAYLASSPRQFAAPEDALPYVLGAGGDLLTSPAVELPPSLEPPPAAQMGADESVRITAFTPNRIELEAKAAQRRVLVLAEMFEKNWKAAVNGAAAPVFPANYLFRGVVVPPGVSRIVLAYRPAAFYWGVALSMCSLILSLGLYWRFRGQSPGEPLAPAEGQTSEPPAPVDSTANLAASHVKARKGRGKTRRNSQ